MARKNKIRKYQWGETPFDGMEHETLKRHALRLMMASENLYGELCKLRHMSDPSQPYWQPGGAGARAVEMFDQAHGPIVKDTDSESAYYSFFRYAGSLLFESTVENKLDRGWVVCPVCGIMYGDRPAEQSLVAKQCGVEGHPDRCTGVFRAFEWSDLQKLADKAAEPVND